MTASKVVSAVLRRRAAVIALTLALAVLAAGGFGRLSFSNDYRHYFSADNPQLAAWESLQRVYTKSDNVLIALTAKTGDFFTPERLALIEELTEAAWQTPYSSRVDSLSNFQHTTARGDELSVGNLVRDARRLDARGVERVRRVALSDPELVHRLVSPDGTTVAVNVTTILADHPVRQIPEVAAFAYRLAERVRHEHPDVAVHLTGAVLFNHALAEASKADMRTLVPLMYATVLFLLWVFLRSIPALVVSACVITLSTVFALGLAGWAGVVLSAASISAPTILLTLALANCVHVFNAVSERLRDGLARREAIAAAMSDNLRPVLLANLTTAIGFLTMNTSEVPPYRDLGNIVAAGCVVIYLLSVAFLPALASLLPLRAPPAARRGRLFARLGDLVIDHRRAVLWVTAALVLVAGVGVKRISLNDLFVEWLDQRYAFRTDTDFIAAHLAGLYRLDYSIASGEADGVSDPRYQRTLDAFAQWYREQPGVVHVHAFTDVMKRLNRSMHGDDPAYYRLPDDRRLAAQYLLLYELSLPFGLDLNSQIDVNRSATRLNVTTGNLPTRELLALAERAAQWLRTNAPSPMHAEAASTTVLFARIAERNIRSLLGSTVAALFVVSLLLVFPLRSLRLGIASLPPNLVPAVLGFGIWGLAVGDVGLAISIVIGMTFGIVVDDTIHFLHRYRHARDALGLAPEGAVRFAFERVGRAMVATTVILAAGFGVLAGSGFAINYQMGLLTAVVLAIGLLADLICLPALLLTLDRRERAPATAAGSAAAAAPENGIVRQTMPALASDAAAGAVARRSGP